MRRACCAGYLRHVTNDEAPTQSARTRWSPSCLVLRSKPRHGWFTNPGSEDDR